MLLLLLSLLLSLLLLLLLSLLSLSLLLLALLLALLLLASSLASILLSLLISLSLSSLLTLASYHYQYHHYYFITHWQAIAQMKEEISQEKETARELDLEVMALDLNSLQSVVKFAEAYKQKGYPLHVLLCNAGIGLGPKGKDFWGIITSYEHHDV